MVLRYIARRLVMVVPVVIGVTVVVFTLIRLAPGDPVQAMLGENPDPQVAVLLRRDLGLDQPLPVQYGIWLARTLRGDLGRSLFTREYVTTLIFDRAPTTISLAGLSMLVAIGIGVPAGVLAATRKDSWSDNLSRLLAMLGVSMPVFWLGLILIIVFALNLRLLPAGGSLDQNGPSALVLPAVALGASFAALIMRLTRSAMLEVLVQDYVRTARAKGLHEYTVNYRHALKAALIPVITVIGFQTGTLLGGAVLTETIFALPGLGRLLTSSINARDYPVILGSVLAVALVFVFVNLVVDVLYALLDPRIKYQ